MFAPTGKAEPMVVDLPIVWAVIITFSLMMYAIINGFDIGIGILFSFVRDHEQSDTMINTVATV